MNWVRLQKKSREKRNGVEWTTPEGAEHSLSNSSGTLDAVHSEWARVQKLRTLQELAKKPHARGRSPNDKPSPEGHQPFGKRQRSLDEDLTVGNLVDVLKKSLEAVSAAKEPARTAVNRGTEVANATPHASIYVPDAAIDKKLEPLLGAGDKINAIALLRAKKPIMTLLQATAYVEALKKYGINAG